MTQVTDETPRTEWFPTTVNPVRTGWYEGIYAGGALDGFTYARYWDGAHWCLSEGIERATFGNDPNVPDNWRGLASDPSI